MSMMNQAIMFANKRIASANGFVNFPRSSTGVMMMVIAIRPHTGMSCGQ